MITMTKLAILQLLHNEFFANVQVQLRETYPSVRPRSFGLYYSPLLLHQIMSRDVVNCRAAMIDNDDVALLELQVAVLLILHLRFC